MTNSAPLKVTITHEVTENTVRTIVSLPGSKPISKSWKRCEGGMIGKFKKDWDEDERLLGWSEIAEAAMNTPRLL